MNTLKPEDFPGPYDPHGQPEFESENKIYLGPFAWNLTGGCGGTKATLDDPDRRSNYWRWPQGAQIIKESDRIGCEFNIPFARWLGHAGETHFDDAQMEFLSVAAGLAPITSRMMLPSTSHVTYFFHPYHFAKWGAVMDNMSNGRWGLNVVAGWIRDEVGLFGVDYPDHDLRYQMCHEFVLFMKLCWELDEPFDFDGVFFKGKNVRVSPKPVRRPRPFFVQAGFSPTAMDFAGKHCDWIFVSNISGDVKDLGVGAKRVREAADKYGRRARVCNFVWNVWAETDQKAEEDYERQVNLVDEGGAAWFTYRALDQPGTKGGTSFAAAISGKESLRESMGEGSFALSGVGLSGVRLIGSYDTIAEEMRIMYRDYGQEGILISGIDRLEDVHQLENHVIPRLVKMGLRKY